jgi:hypothetical protein
MKSQVFFRPVTDSSSNVTPFLSNEPFFTANASILSYLIRQKELIKHSYSLGEALEENLANLKAELLSISNKYNENSQLEDSEPSIQDVRNVICNEVLDYDYKLSLIDPLPAPICKGKYISLAVEVAPIMFESNLTGTLSVSISLYTSDCPPIHISHAVLGRSILKGNSSTMVVYDSKLKKFIARFRIQIREVSSRFKNGWIFIVLAGTKDETHSYSLIRPMVMKRIIIKAKDLSTLKRRNC